MNARSSRVGRFLIEATASHILTLRSWIRVVLIMGAVLCLANLPAVAQTGSGATPKRVAQLGVPEVSAEPPIIVVQAEKKKPEAKAPQKKGAMPEGKEAVIRISTQPPSREELFRLDTELQLRERILKEAQQAGVKLQMTEFGGVVRQPMPLDRDFPEQYSTYLPSTLCYGRLFFEQRASERYGRNVWGLQPALSVGRFYVDLALWPVRLATWPVRPMDCNDDEAGFVWERVASPRHPWWLW